MTCARHNPAAITGQTGWTLKKTDHHFTIINFVNCFKMKKIRGNRKIAINNRVDGGIIEQPKTESFGKIIITERNMKDSTSIENTPKG